jgi:hypothetical protein
MGLQTIEKTDHLRRLALQLALQLPEAVDDARRVLTMTGQCLDEFLIDRSPGPSAWQRARRLGWRAAPDLVPDLGAEGCQVGDDRPRSLSAVRALCVALATLGVSAPAAMLLVRIAGVGDGFCFGFAVILVSMVFGTIPALVLAGASLLVHNLVVLPPAFTFQAPTVQECVLAGFYVIFALTVPPLMRRVDRLRGLAARPLKMPD